MNYAGIIYDIVTKNNINLRIMANYQFLVMHNTLCDAISHHMLNNYDVNIENS